MAVDRRLTARRLVLSLAVALGLGAAIGVGCSSSSDHPPELSSPNAYSIDDAVECQELYAVSGELQSQIPGPLTYDGGAAHCLVPGTQCPLADPDGGLCDGGPTVALPAARCLGTRWTGACVLRDAAATD